MYQQKWRIEVSGFAAGGITWDLLWEDMRFKIGSRGRRWCQVLEGVLGALGVIEEIKCPCDCRG